MASNLPVQESDEKCVTARAPSAVKEKWWLWSELEKLPDKVFSGPNMRLLSSPTEKLTDGTQLPPSNVFVIVMPGRAEK